MRVLRWPARSVSALAAACVGLTTLLPVAAQSQKGEDETEVFLSKPEFNPALPADAFDTRLPEGKEWQGQEVPLK